MVIERTNSSSRGSRSSNSSSNSPSTSRRISNTKVLAIECIRGTSRADEWSGGLLQTGDIVEQIQIGDLILQSPFKDGNSGVQKYLHSYFKSKVTEIKVRVRRGEFDSAELAGCIVPEGNKKKRYVLRAIDDPNYAAAFFDRTESECFVLQASRDSRLHHALNNAQIQDGYVPYPWEKKMQIMLQAPNSSCYFSILFLPKASETGRGLYNDVEDTLARANAWLNAAQASGVPIVFTNIQTESLLTKISGETASSTVNTSSLSDLPNLANASLYGFEDYHGVDIGVVRAIRLWYSPIQEFPVEINIEPGDVKLGFAVSRTEEGFIYISSALEGDGNVPSARSGLNDLYSEAKRDSKLLVISRVNNQKVLPWIVSQTSAIQCFDTVSLSQKLSLHRHAQEPLLFHVMMQDSRSPRRQSGPAPLAMPSLPNLQLPSSPDTDQSHPLPPSHDAGLTSNPAELGLSRDTAGEDSFRFQNFALPASWV
ncbi:Elongation factor Tu chloroplastic [Bienertia sinuspersici]